MPKLVSHPTHPERAESSADRGFLLVGRAIRNMRVDRGWTQEELARRILLAEGYEDTQARLKNYNAKVSRRENGHPTTLRTLTGFALAFGYRNVWDWFSDLFSSAALSEPEQALLDKFRATDPAIHPVLMALLESVQHTMRARKAGAAKGPKPPRRPQ